MFDFKIKKKSIFIIDDDLELTNLMERILKSIDATLEIYWTTSAEEALAILRKRSKKNSKAPFDIMICDIFLEGQGNGVELWNFCQKHYPGMKTALISSLEKEKFEALIKILIPEPPFLQKPFSVSQFNNLYSELSVKKPEESLPAILV